MSIPTPTTHSFTPEQQALNAAIASHAEEKSKFKASCRSLLADFSKLYAALLAAKHDVLTKDEIEALLNQCVAGSKARCEFVEWVREGEGDSPVTQTSRMTSELSTGLSRELVYGNHNFGNLKGFGTGV